MFGRLKNDVQRVEPTSDASLQESPLFASDLLHTPPTWGKIVEGEREEEPETIIAENVEIKGTLRFQRFLRIDGSFEGELLADGKLIIGPTGCVRANIDLDEAFISGKVVGNITVKKRLVLRGKAEITGDINAPVLSVDEGVSLIGIVNVVPNDSTQIP